MVLTAVMVFAPFVSYSSSLIPEDTVAQNALRLNAPAEYSDGGVPRFLLWGKPGKVYFGVGGQIKATIAADFGHPIDAVDEFTTSSIPMGPMQGNGSKFHISARQTALFMNLVAFPDDANKVGAFVGINFVDRDYAPVLVYAYMRWRGLQAGYDYNLFSDPSSNPPGEDYEGPSAILSTGAAYVRWTQYFGPRKRWSAAIGLEMPRASFTDASREGRDYAWKVSQRVPDIPVAIQYSWAEGQHVRIAGLLRNLYYRKAEPTGNIDQLGWGVHLSAVGEILPGLSGFGSVWYGKGIASFCQDLYDGGLDLIPTPDGRSMTALEVWGTYVGLEYAFNDKWSLDASYSLVRTYADQYVGGAVPWAQQYRRAQYADAMLSYQISDCFSTGLEYIWGQRVNNDLSKAVDTRIQAAFTFSF